MSISLAFSPPRFSLPRAHEPPVVLTLVFWLSCVDDVMEALASRMVSSVVAKTLKTLPSLDKSPQVPPLR